MKIAIILASHIPNEEGLNVGKEIIDRIYQNF